MIDKPIVWIGSSRRDLRDFPDEARRKVGFELRAVQRGEEPSDFKPWRPLGLVSMKFAFVAVMPTAFSM